MSLVCKRAVTTFELTHRTSLLDLAICTQLSEEGLEYVILCASLTRCVVHCVLARGTGLSSRRVRLPIGRAESDGADYDGQQRDRQRDGRHRRVQLRHFLIF